MTAYITAADFRSASLAEYCAGLPLSDQEANSTILAAGIASLQTRLNQYANDVFEPESLTLELDAEGTTRLLLPKRCTAATTVKVRAEDGTLSSAVTSTLYRLHSSLDSTGAKRVGEFDWIEIVPSGGGLPSLPANAYNPYTWPWGPQTVQVVGTFGWTTCPADIKRALALMVYHRFKPIRNDLRFATRVTTNNESVDYAISEPTGIPEADLLIREYHRDPHLGV